MEKNLQRNTHQTTKLHLPRRLAVGLVIFRVCMWVSFVTTARTVCFWPQITDQLCHLSLFFAWLSFVSFWAFPYHKSTIFFPCIASVFSFTRLSWWSQFLLHPRLLLTPPPPPPLPVFLANDSFSFLSLLSWLLIFLNIYFNDFISPCLVCYYFEIKIWKELFCWLVMCFVSPKYAAFISLFRLRMRFFHFRRTNHLPSPPFLFFFNRTPKIQYRTPVKASQPRWRF